MDVMISLSRHTARPLAAASCTRRPSTAQARFHFSGAVLRTRSPSRVVVRAETEAEEADFSGEWPVNWSLASYEDVGEFFANNLFKDDAAPGSLLGDVMSTDLTVTTADASLESIKNLFDDVTGVPVVKSQSDYTLVGVISRKDMQKTGKTVADVMSTPPVAAKPEAKVGDAAALMLKHKVHRIPIVDSSAKVVGIVTRTDIFTALAT